jgi:hypothetical protein
MTDTMREKIARGMATVDGYEFDKLAPLNCVVSPRMNGKDHWFKLADAVLALIAPVMEENAKALSFDEPDAFERWWGSYKHKNRELADYTRKKCIAFDAFHEALEQARAALSLKSENRDG